MRNQNFLPIGLRYQPVPGDGSCFFHAAALYLQENAANLRDKIANHIENHPAEFSEFITGSLREYIAGIRSGSYAEHIEIAALERAVNRPVIVIRPDLSIGLNNSQRYPGEPIFVYYNGHNHYDALLLEEGADTRRILEELRKGSLIRNIQRSSGKKRARVNAAEKKDDHDALFQESSKLFEIIENAIKNHFTVYVVDKNTDIQNHVFHSNCLLLFKTEENHFALFSHDKEKQYDFFVSDTKDIETLEKILKKNTKNNTPHKLSINYNLCKKIIEYVHAHLDLFPDYQSIFESYDFLKRAVLFQHKDAHNPSLGSDESLRALFAEIKQVYYTLECCSLKDNILIDSLEKKLNRLLPYDNGLLIHPDYYHLNLLRFSKYLFEISCDSHFYRSAGAPSARLSWMAELIASEKQKRFEKKAQDNQHYAFRAIISMIENRMMSDAASKKDVLDRNVASHFIRSILKKSHISDKSSEFQALLLLFYINMNLRDPYLLQTVVQIKPDEVILEGEFHLPPLKDKSISGSKEKVKTSLPENDFAEIADYLSLHDEPAVLPEEHQKAINHLSNNKILLRAIRHKTVEETLWREQLRWSPLGNLHVVRAHPKKRKRRVELEGEHGQNRNSIFHNSGASSDYSLGAAAPRHPS